jgi:hypothetical protein
MLFRDESNQTVQLGDKGFAADYFGVSKATIDRMRADADNPLKCVLVRGQVRFRLADLVEYTQRNTSRLAA